MDSREHSILSRCGNKDDVASGCSRHRHHIDPRPAASESAESLGTDGSSAGIIILEHWLPNAATKAIQILLALPFLRGNYRSYLARSFDFGRQFLFKWTVNWRFIGEEIFLAKGFASILLLLTTISLLIFISTRWTRPSGASLPSLLKPQLLLFSHRIEQAPVPSLPSSFVLITILTSMVLGLSFARSLHYQFFAYLGWSTPILLWKSGMHPVLLYFVCLLQEWAWQQYPSTNLSSLAVVGCLLTQVFSVWYGTRYDFAVPDQSKGEKTKAKTKVKSDEAVMLNRS